MLPILKSKLRRQLFPIVIVPTALVVLLGSSLYFSLNRVLQDLKSVEIAQDKAILTLEMNLALERQIKAMRGYLYSGYPDLKQEAQTQARILTDLSDRAVETFESQRDRDRFHELGEISVEIADYVQRIIDLYDREGDTEAVLDLWTEAVSVVRTAEFGDLTRDIKSEAIALIADKKERLQHDIARNQAVAGGATLLLILLAIGLLRAITTNLTSRLEALGDRISSIVERLSSVAGNQDTVVCQQVQAVDRTAAAVQQLEVSARNSERMASDLLAKSQAMSGFVSQGSDCVRRNFEETHQLRDRVEGITDRNRKLSDCSQSISTIAGLVGTLARQTNMLALNAAIEATHAGDRGRGFALISTEIRALADRSRQSSEEIDGFVRDIQQAAEATTNAIDGSALAATNSVVVAQQTRDVLDQINRSLDASADGIHEIARTIREQALAVQQIADSMNQLSNAANDINQATETVQTTIGELAGVTRELSSIL